MATGRVVQWLGQCACEEINRHPSSNNRASHIVQVHPPSFLGDISAQVLSSATQRHDGTQSTTGGRGEADCYLRYAT